MFKWISRIILAINSLMETYVGIIFLVAPEKSYQVIKAITPTGGSLSLMPRMYGLAAFCLGLFSFLLLIRKKETDFLAAGFLMLGIFHCGLFSVQMVDNPNWIHIGPVHLILGLIFLFLSLSKFKLSQSS